MNRRSASDSHLAAGWIAAFLALGLFGQGTLEASSSSDESRLASELSSSLSRLGREKFQALVRIRCRDEAGEISGNGFLIDPTGTICTLAEFLRDGNGVEIESSGKTFPATVFSIDERTGIAFLKTSIPATSFIPPFPSAKLSGNSPIEALATMASEHGPAPMPLLGTTGEKFDHDGERFFPVPLLAARLPSAASMPGTPVFDLSGKFAGIVVRTGLKDESCAILPATAVEKLHGDLLRFGKINPGWIGAVVEEAAVPEGTSRTRIAAIEPGSPAEKAGIRSGDSLISIGDRPIMMPEEVLESSFYLTAGQEIRIVLSRSGELKRVTLRCAPVPGETVLTQK
jgi:serine protease Do